MTPTPRWWSRPTAKPWGSRMPGSGRGSPKGSQASWKACAGKKATASWPTWPNAHPTPALSTWPTAKQTWVACSRRRSGAATQRTTWCGPNIYALCGYNRCLDGQDLKLFAQVAEQPPLGHIEFVLEACGQRKARRVVQSLRALRVVLKRHAPIGHGLEVTVILAQEDNPPPGGIPGAGC